MTTHAISVGRPAAPSSSPPGGDARHVVVVGAGLGGLAAAIRLRHRGFRVTVLERHAHPGGRCGLWESEGFRFDTGPTLLLMVDYLRALFAEVGRPLEHYLELRQLDPNYRVHYADGTTLDVTSRLNAVLEGLERIEPGVGPRFLRFLSETAQLYRIGLDSFVDRNCHRRGDFFNLNSAWLLLKARGMERLQRMVRRYFRTEKLQHTFSFQSLYLGLSPFDSPAIYSLLPYTEVAGGLYFPMGGMHAMPRALARLAGEMGVTVEYGRDVRALEREGGRIAAVRLADGSRVPADLVLANADLPYVYETLLGEKYPRIDRFDFSCSAFLMYLGVNRRYPELTHHALVVPRDLKATCDDIFAGRLPEDPAYYVCNPSKTDPTLAPPGCENLYVLVPVPSQLPGREIDWSVEGPRLEAEMLERLERFGLPDLRRHIVTRRTFTPADFTLEFSATRGEAFGLAHGIDQVGYFRPHNRHPRLDNLYFVGQSTHPGCGIPMVLISSRLVAERMVEEQAVRP
ncbi:MAG TPA: phytoene desaturase family protein [Gemmatimonadales bacterium]|nr:phytoene desaturase family protein [Gemmatimonadales bacterium]